MQYQKQHCLVIFCLLVVLGLPTSAQKAKSANEISREQGQAVVVIEALDAQGEITGQGSGFIVTPNGALITNLHVVQGATQVRVKLPNGDVYKTQEIVDFDDTKDIAILKLKGFKLPVVALGDSDKTETGENVTVISSPEGLANSLSTGVVSGVRRMEGMRVFQITAPISEGSSGGALFDSAGAVVGIITYVLRAGQNINFAVPINYARGMISDHATRTLAQLPPATTKKAANEIALAPAPPTAASVPASSVDQRQSDIAAQQLSTVVRGGRLGRTPAEPMFMHPGPAMILLNRFVDGIGLYTFVEIEELTRTATLLKAGETTATELYAISYLTANMGLALTVNRKDHTLTSVELLVNWSLDDAVRTFGDKYKRRTIANQTVLEFKPQKEADTKTVKQVVAVLDESNIVRSVRFTKGK